MIESWLLFTWFIFCVGIYGMLTRRNAVGLLVSVELMLNSGALNFVALNRFVLPNAVDGQVMAVFVIALAAAEVLLGMAILLLLFRKKSSVDVTTLQELRH